MTRLARIAAGLCVPLVLCGCVSYLGPLAEDHTVGLISRPVSAPVELLWRATTLGCETAGRLHVNHIKFPRLEKVPTHAVRADRAGMPESIMRDWLEKTSTACAHGNLTLLINGDRFFPRLETALSRATNQIDIQVYIFDNDDVAVRLADLLRSKSTDVSIRILVDGLGSRRAWAIQAPSAGSAAQPDIGNMARYLSRGSNIQLRRWRNLWLSSGHTKMMIVDGSTAFIGGMNIGREYRYDWRDAMVEIDGPLVAELQRSFVRAWDWSRWSSDLSLLSCAQSSADKPGSNEGARCYVLKTSPFKRQIYRTQLLAARSATHHIYVESPYLWNDKFIYALCEARRRGVDVRVTVPNTGLALAMGAQNIALNTLLRHGVRVFLFPGKTHVKAAVFDGWACFGSANLDDLSLHKNNELSIFTADQDFVREFEHELLLKGQDLSLEITDPMPSGWWDVLFEGIADFL